MPRTLIAALTIIVASVSTIPIVAPTSAYAAAPICDDLVEIVAFRGSGEDMTDADGASDEWLGPRLKRIVDEGRTMSTSDGVNLAHAPVFGVPGPDYPAIPLSDYLDFNPLHLTVKPEKMIKSAGQGALAALKHIYQAHRDCPARTFILLGYSQGASAARLALEGLPDSWVAGVFTIGDPELRSGAAYAHGEGADGGGGSLVGFFDLGPGNADDVIPDKLKNAPFPAYSFCHDKDPVCDIVHLDGGPHGTYGQDVAERRALAGEIVDMYRTAKEHPPVTPGSPALDVVFAIDTTGSMTPYIDGARASAERIAEQLRAGSSSFRVGLAEYRDQGDPFVARIVTPLTEDVSAFSSGLNGLVADGGGDTPEAVYSGMITAAGSAWRPDTRRTVIVIGDAPAHDPELVTGYTKDDVLRSFGVAPASRAAARFATVADGPIRLYGLAADSTLQAQLELITAETGGLSLALGNPDDVATQITQSLDDATQAPTVSLHVGLPVVVATPTTMTAVSASDHVGLSFEWDVDGDGIFETTTTDPVHTNVYAEPGPVTARVRVTDAEGRQAVSSVTFTVLGPLAAAQLPVPTPTPSPSVTPTPTPTPTPSATASPSSAGTPTGSTSESPPSGGGLSHTGSPTMRYVLIGLLMSAAGVGLLLLSARSRRARRAGD